MNGRASSNAAPKPKPRMPSTSPSMKKMCDGMSFRVWNCARKYHSGLMPGGAGANGSAFVPNSHGKNTARQISDPSTKYQHISSRKKKFGKNLISLRSVGLTSQCASTDVGTLV